MKILYLVDDRFPPFRPDVVDLFSREFVARGHILHWMMRRGPEGMAAPARISWLGSRAFLSPAVRCGGLLGRVLNLMLETWGDLQLLGTAVHGRYDVIQVRDRFAVSLWAWLVARLTGARFTYWMSYPFAESKLEQARLGFAAHPRLTWIKAQWIGLLLYRVILPLSDHVFVQSQRMKEDLVGKGIAPAKMTPVPMGIRDEQVGNAGDARAPNTSQPLLLYLGVAMRMRQTEMLVRVLAMVRRRYPSARLRYVGEGQKPIDRQAIVDEAARLGLQDAVEMTGFLPREQALDHVRQADICFSPIMPIPALLPASPTKLVEYLALAKCVVANEHPDQSQVLEESGAGRAVPWDEEAFAREAIAMLDDPVAARERAARGPDYVRRHRTYAVIAERVERALQALIAESPRKAG